jgi:hypothetical protein
VAVQGKSQIGKEIWVRGLNWIQRLEPPLQLLGHPANAVLIRGGKDEEF